MDQTALPERSRRLMSTSSFTGLAVASSTILTVRRPVWGGSCTGMRAWLAAVLLGTLAAPPRRRPWLAGMETASSVTCPRSEEHTSELQSPYVISYAVFFLKEAATTALYPLSLHDALPICALGHVGGAAEEEALVGRHGDGLVGDLPALPAQLRPAARREAHLARRVAAEEDVVAAAAAGVEGEVGEQDAHAVAGLDDEAALRHPERLRVV